MAYSFKEEVPDMRMQEDLTQSGDGTAKANVTTFAGDIFGVFSYPGRYLNDDGQVSSYNFLQDRDYYQNFSYVVKAPLSISKYRTALKRLNALSGTIKVIW
jgi:hypothetical protein